MSRTVDQRVVEMQFDNRQFERNVSTTMSTLNKLNQSLNMPGATKGLENVGAAAKGINLSGLSSAAETVGLKFNAMYSMADQALRNITNSAMAAGKRIVSALTVDPIKTGFTEYETKINAIQTIMSNTASKGTTMEDVTRVIGELNTYADKTIYNFAEMTRNIGTFTAAGVGLEESAAAIQGIANLAASSGSTSQQASTAMYQLSQALAAGTVKLMDWNSVVNAGMGGEKFQEALKQTAREYGTDVDALIEKNGSFRESLQEGWITADILNTTLQKFTTEGAKEYAQSMLESGKYTKEQADALLKEAQAMEDAATKVKTFTQLWDTLKESAQSGWSQSWEIIVGDFEEAKDLLTKISEVFGGMIGDSAEARNNLLQGWKDAGGRDDLITALSNAFEILMNVIKPIKEAFREIFPPITVEQLVKFTRGLKELTEKFMLIPNAVAPVKKGLQEIAFGSKEAAEHNEKINSTIDKLARTFKGLFAIASIIVKVIKAVARGFFDLLGMVMPVGEGILSLTANIGDWLVALNETVDETDIFNKTVQGIVDTIKLVVDAITRFTKAFKVKFVNPSLEAMGALLDRIRDRIDHVGNSTKGFRLDVVAAFEAMHSALKNSDFLGVFGNLWKAIKMIGSGIAKALGALTGGLIDKLGNGDFNGIFDFFNTLSFSAIAAFIAKFVKGFSDITDSIGSFKESAIGILDEVKGCFEAYQTQLKAGTLMKIATAIAILVGSILVLSFIDSDKLSGAIGAITMLFVNLMGAMAIFGRISGDLKGIARASMAMLGMSTAVLIMASAMKKLGDMEWEQIAKGAVGVFALTAIIVGAAKVLSMGDKKVIKGALQMVIFAAAIKILASVAEDLSALSWEQIAKGLFGVGILLAEVALFLKFAKLSGKSIATATGIVILAAALKILASACQTFAKMSWEELGKGLASIAGLLLAIAVFTRLSGKAEHVIATGIALIAIAAAMKIFASAMHDLASLTWGEVAKGLVSMAGALLAITIAARLMPKNMIGIAAGLVVTAAALLIVANALDKMGGMTWEEIAKGLAALAGSLGLLAIGLHLMNGTLAGSAALIVAALAIAVLTPALQSLGNMSWGEIVKGLAMIAGVFVVLGLAGLILQPLVPTILALSAAFVLLGVGVLAIGAGLVLAGAGLSALAIGITALSTALAGGATAITAGLTVIVMGIANLIPMVIAKIGEGLIAFCKVISDGAPAIGEALKALLLTAIDVLVECVPPLADGMLTVLVSVWQSLAKHTPEIVVSIFDFLIGLINAVAEKLPELIEAGVNLLMSFFAGIFDAFAGMDTEVLLKGLAGIGILSGIMIALNAVAGLVPGAMVGVLGVGAVIAELAIVLAAIGALAQIPGLEWLIGEGGDLLQTIGTALGQFVGGIVGGVAEGVTACLPEIGKNLSDFMTNVTPFIEGVKNVDCSVLEGAGVLAGAILALTVADLLAGVTQFLTLGYGFAQLGTDLSNFMTNAQGFIQGAAMLDENMMAGVKTLAETVLILTAANVVEGLTRWITGGSSLANFGSQLPELGTNLNSFVTNLGTFTQDQVAAVGCAADAIRTLAAAASELPNEGGWAAKILGDNSIATFGSYLPDLGTNLASFATNLGTFGEDQIATVTCAANAIKEMALAADAIPNEGGWVAKIVGDNSIATFASNLPTLGTNLKDFATNLGTFGEDQIATVSCAANAIKEMALAADAIPNDGGWAATILGDNSIATFGSKLPDLGTNLKDFAANLGTFGEDQIATVKCAATAVKEMAQAAQGIDGQSEWAKTIFGDNGIAAFSSQFPTLGTNLASFASNLGTFDSAKVETVKQAINAIKAFAALADTNLKSAKSHLEGFSDKLPGLGADIATFATNVSDSYTIASAVSNAKRIMDTVKEMSAIDTTAAKNFTEALKKVGTDGVSAFTKAFTNETAKVNVKHAAEALAAKVVDGFKAKKNDFKKAADDLADSGVPAIKTQANLSAWKGVGKYLVQGFCSGIDENTFMAEAKAAAMAKAAYKAACEALDINSPSKVFRKVGGSVPEGFAQGIDRFGYMVTNSVVGMADRAVTGIGNAISRISYAINADMDTQPTIRPVLDLSEVRTGAGAVNDMFAMNPSVGVMSNVRSISSMMNQRGQNGNSDDVVSAINRLGKSLAGVRGGDTYQVNGVTYDDGSNVINAIEEIVRHAKIERRR